jgi:hypothetical protein
MPRTKDVKFSTVIPDAITEGLPLQSTAERSDEVLEHYKKAFSAFSDEEMSILDGVILEAVDQD